MKLKLLIFLSLFFGSTYAQDFEWAKSMGDIGADIGNSITTDATGNVYTTGTFAGTVDFDHGTNVFNLTAVGGTDIFITKYDTYGNFIWAKSFGGLSPDAGFGITTDLAGNIIIIGTYQSTVDFDPNAGIYNLTSLRANVRDMFISKLDTNGNFVWAKSFGGSAFGHIGRSICTDALGNIYATGYFTGTSDFDPSSSDFLLAASNDDVFILKIDNNGDFVWAKKIGGSQIQQGNSIAIDNTGNLYVTGYCFGTMDFDPGVGVFNLTSAGTFDIFAVKLDNNGDFVWGKLMGGSGNDQGNAIALDPAGNVYVTGVFQYSNADFDPGPNVQNLVSSINFDVFVLKLDNYGNFIWAKSFGGQGEDKSSSIVTDAIGNVYFAGNFGSVVFSDLNTNAFNLNSNGGGNAGGDIFITKLNNAGDVLWAKNIGGTGADLAFSMTLDTANSIYVTGSFSNVVDFNPSVSGVTSLTAIASSDIFILKLSQQALPSTSPQSFCSGATVANLTATGTALQWYTTATGGTALADNIVLTTATYYVSQTVNGIESTRSGVVITVNPSVTPTFPAVSSICSGETLAALPTTSTNGITGTWSPALNNLATTTYTFTPATGQCAASTSLTITVNPSITPTFTAVDSICSGETLAALPTTSTNGITGTWSPALDNLATTTYTFTPATGQCATTTTLTIAVNSSITPTFTAIAPICSGETLLPLPTTSLNGIDGSWWPVLNNTATTTYTFRPKPDQCAAEITVTITVNSPAIPTFTAVVPICSGEMLAALPTTSLDGFTGTWSPALNNWATTTYTFTPAVGQCATTATMTIVVTPVVLPNFAPVSPICAGSILTALPTTSTNGITGTWSPALNNTTTTFYIFTPTAGQCAKKVELLIKVLPNKSPNFNPVPPICLGKTLAPLPTTSLDGYTGTWSPALNNTVTTTYTFTPTVGQCAVPVTMTIVVDPPTLGGVVSGGTTICRSSTSGVLTLSGHVGIIVRWESSTNNFVTKTNINNNTTTHISGPLTTTTQFRAVIQGICGEGFSTSTTVTPVVVLSPAALRLTDNAISPLTAITDVSRYIGTSVPLTLTATTVSGATSYEWEFPAGVNQLSGGTSNTVTIDFAGVGPGATSLYLGAKARNGDCISTRNNSTLIPATFSTARLLRVSANIPATPSALKLTDDAISTSLGINNVSRYIGTTVPLTLTANVSVNANSYDWELPAGVTQLSGGNTNIISVNFAGVGAGVTSLYLGAVARNGVGVSIRNNSSLVPVTTSTARLLKVTASVPSTVSSVTGQIVGICGGNTYNYSISPSVLATSYIITAPAGSIVTSLSNPLNVTNTLSTTDLMFSVLYPTNLASVAPRTIVINAVNGVGSNLTNRTLNISTTLPSIGIATGSEGITTFQRCNTQTFTVPAVVGATSYLWEVINGAAIVGASNTNTVEVDFSLVPIFSTTNLVKVRAVNACGIFSNVRNITLSSIPCTVLRGATKEIKNTYNDGPIMGMANMYPNPTSGAFKLDLEMLAKGQVDIEIYASNAGVIETNKGVHLEKGTNTIEMDISNLAIGVYMVRITNTTTDEVLVKRIIKE